MVKISFSVILLISLNAQALYLPFLGHRNHQTNHNIKHHSAHVPYGWHLLSDEYNGIQGIASFDVQSFYPIRRYSEKIIVAVIDSGIDISHADLDGRIWTNPLEIPDNNFDDDNNGYIDDIHGWNFLGGHDYDSHELVRKVQFLERNDPDNLEIIPAKHIINLTRDQLIKQQGELQKDLEILETSFSVIENNHGDHSIFETAIDKLIFKYGSEKDLRQLYQDTIQRLKFVYNLNHSQHSPHMGNNLIALGPNLVHGTHVAGIIAANQNNGIGIDGITNHVQIMPIKAIPIGSERNLHIAKAIRYAVDNGAKIINLSFNKYFSDDTYLQVEHAIEYALKKNTLVVHSAGNENYDLNSIEYYPKGYPTNNPTKRYPHWIEVGASNIFKNKNLITQFSNYGKSHVDLFAPGQNIHSLAPDDKTILLSGTSMAAPMVSATAAELWIHHPHLSAKQIKDIILKSASRILNIRINGKGSRAHFFTDYSRSGGILNLRNALDYSYQYNY